MTRGGLAVYFSAVEYEQIPADCRGCEWLAILELLPGPQALWLECLALMPALSALRRQWYKPCG